MSQHKDIESFIIKHISDHPGDIVAFAMGQLNLSRTTVRRHLTYLIRDGLVVKTGTTKNIQYALKQAFDKKVIINLPSKEGEYEIFKAHFSQSCNRMPAHVYDIILYGVTEMINNAFDHALAKKVVVELKKDKHNIIFCITDDGVGIFQKIATHEHFSDIRESILTLNKGKFTTDRRNHSGEGIFFTSRIFDVFLLSANGIQYLRDNNENDWFVHGLKEKKPGTSVMLVIDENSPKQLNDIFHQFQNPETLAFDRTEITVELSRLGEEAFISRSQAKRILRNLEGFSSITLDFKGVRIIGQGFADEVFRVYQFDNPDKTIRYINANGDVLFMIERTLATK